MATRITWDKANFKWDNNPHTWDEVLLVAEVTSDGASGEEIAYNVNQLDPEKKKRFIKLICKVKGIETYSGQKTIKTDDIDITVKDVELVIKEVLGKSITVENINV